MGILDWIFPPPPEEDEIGLKEVLSRLERLESRIEELAEASGGGSEVIARLEEILARLKANDDRLSELTRAMDTGKAGSRGRILAVLKKPMTTSEICALLGLSRPHTSLCLNEMERHGLVREAGRRGRSVLYEKV